MLDSMRTVQSSWVGKALMGLLFILIIVGLSFFGFADLFRSATATWVAKVGGTEISAESFRQAYQSNLQQMQQRLRRSITNQQARQMGLDQQVLSRLVTDAVIDNEAAKLGLAMSDQQIARVITQDSTFAGANGQFDHNRFLALLRDNGLTEQGFIRDQRSAYLRQQIVDAIVGTMPAPTATVDALHRYQTETRSIDMIDLPPSIVGDVPLPDEATLQKFYDERKQSFAAPEYRKLTVLAVTPASVAKPADVSEEDLRKAYETAPEAQFGAPERRTLEQIVFPNQAEAEAAALRVQSGTSFEAIAAERHVDPKDLNLGTVAKSAIFDPAVADAAFSLPVNGTSDPVKGTFGTVLIHVAAIDPGTRKPFDEVAPALRQQIAESPARTRDSLRDIRDKIEDQRSSGKTLTEAAQSAGLSVKTIDAVDASGHDPAGTVADVPDRDAVLKAAFASDIGVDNDVIQTRDGHEVWFEVGGITPAHAETFAEARSKVEAAWRADEVAKRLAAKADELQKSLGSGQTIEQVAAAAGNLAVKHVGDLKRSGANGVSQAVALRAFDTPVNGSGVAEGENGSRVVFRVLDSVVPPLDRDAPETRQMAEQYGTLFADDVLTAILTRFEGTVGIKVNPQVLNSAIGSDG